MPNKIYYGKFNVNRKCLEKQWALCSLNEIGIF